MCYEFERFYWLERAEQLRKEQAKAETSGKPRETPAPAKPAELEPAIERPQPLPV